MKNNKIPNNIWKWLAFFFLLIAIIVISIWGFQKYQNRQATQVLEELKKMPVENNDISSNGNAEKKQDKNNNTATTVTAKKDNSEELPQENSAPSENTETVNPLEKVVDFKTLTRDVNEDIYAWVSIPDTEIDYPILQHATDNTHYLNYNIDGSKGYPGCIYTENYNSKDFTDPNTVLYGHNMKNGTMFAGLHEYKDINYFAEHPYIYIYTPEHKLTYEIFAAYEYSNIHLLLNYDFNNVGVYQQYINEIQTLRSMTYIYKEDFEWTTEDKIITLSTCIADKPSNRYLVQGVLINEE